MSLLPFLKLKGNNKYFGHRQGGKELTKSSSWEDDFSYFNQNWGVSWLSVPDPSSNIKITDKIRSNPIFNLPAGEYTVVWVWEASFGRSPCKKAKDHPLFISRVYRTRPTAGRYEATLTQKDVCALRNGSTAVGTIRNQFTIEEPTRLTMELVAFNDKFYFHGDSKINCTAVIVREMHLYYPTPHNNPLIVTGSGTKKDPVVVVVSTGSSSSSGGSTTGGVTTAGTSKTICAGDPIPKGYVVVKVTESDKCPGPRADNAWIIKKPGETETVCKGSAYPIPDDYVIVSETSTSDCVGPYLQKNAWVITDVSKKDRVTVCSGSPVPSNFKKVKEVHSSFCPNFGASPNAWIIERK